MNTKEQDQDPENTILEWCAMEDSEYRVRVRIQSQNTESEYRVRVQSQSTVSEY